MEVSLRVVVHFLLHVLVCSGSPEVTITRNENFTGSGLVLVCLEGNFPLTRGVSFQRNGMDILVNGTGIINGTLSYPLTQENEGNFTCTFDGRTSDPITLAGI